jgi:hypothetical protein
MAVIDQVVTDKYALYNGDSAEVLGSMPEGSIDFSIYSPPFAQPGGGALYSNGGLYGLNTRALYGLDAVTPDTRVLDLGRLGAVLAGERRDLGDGPPDWCFAPATR